jgi:IMP dehydrogenase
MSQLVRLHLLRTINEYKQLQKIRVKDLMISGNVITTNPEKTIDDVLEMMIKHNISGMPVVDKRGVMIGFVTLRDIGKVVTTNPTLKVREVMIKNPPYTTTNEDIITAFEKMINFNKKLDQLPVINTEYPEKILGTLEGIIFMEDIIKVLYEYVIKELKTLVSLYDKKSII